MKLKIWTLLILLNFALCAPLMAQQSGSVPSAKALPQNVVIPAPAGSTEEVPGMHCPGRIVSVKDSNLNNVQLFYGDPENKVVIPWDPSIGGWDLKPFVHDGRQPIYLMCSYKNVKKPSGFIIPPSMSFCKMKNANAYCS